LTIEKSVYLVEESPRVLADARTSPSWLNRDTKQLSGNIQRLPERAEIDAFLNEQLIVEYYSR